MQDWYQSSKTVIELNLGCLGDELTRLYEIRNNPILTLDTFVGP